MFTWYSLFKFLHVASVSIWLGGLTTMTIVHARLARVPAADVARVARQTVFVGPAILGPSAGISLITGIVLLGLLKWQMELWMAWGLAAVVLSIALGATVLRRTQIAWDALTPDSEEARVQSLRHRLVVVNLINITVLLSTVFVMVVKPTF